MMFRILGKITHFVDEDDNDNDKYASDEEKPQPVKRISSTKFVDVPSKCVDKTF